MSFVSVKDRASAIAAACKGMGTDDSALIAALGHATNETLLDVASAYERDTGKRLSATLQKETSGRYRTLLLALTTRRAEVLAGLLHKSVKGFGTDDALLQMVLCYQAPAEIKQVKRAYKAEYKKKLRTAIKGDTSGNYETLLLQLLKAKRSTGGSLNMKKVQQDVETIIVLLKKKDHKEITKIATDRSFAHIGAMTECYRNATGKDLAAAVRSRFSGQFARCLERIFRAGVGASEGQSTPAGGIAYELRRCKKKHSIALVLLAQQYYDKMPFIYTKINGKSLTKANLGSGNYGRLARAAVGVVSK